MKRHFYTVSFLLLYFSVKVFSNAEFNSVRLAYLNSNLSLNKVFLERAKMTNHNYIMIEFRPTTLVNFRNAIRDAAKLCLEEGLHFIPEIQMGSKWALFWEQIAQNDGYARLEINKHSENGTPYGCPSMAPDLSGVTDGMDAAFIDMLNEINIGYNNAKTLVGSSVNLEYIFLGHDEPVCDAHILIGNQMNSESYSLLDYNYLSANGGVNSSDAYQKLFAEEIYRRVTQVQAVFSSPKPKIIIMADLWDPEANGGNWKSTNNGSIRMVNADWVKSGLYYHGIAYLPGLSFAEKDLVKTNVVLSPWCYYKMWIFPSDPTNDGDYNSNSTFSYFSANGFKILPMSSINNSHDDEITIEKINAMREYITEARNFRNNVIGYVSAPWGHWNTNQSMFDQERAYETLEYMHRLTRGNPSRYTSSSY